MKSFFFLLAVSAAGAAALAPPEISILLPSSKPTGPSDLWECALSAYTPYFSPPLPTGAVLSAMESYGDELIADCTDLICPYPDATRWCGVTTAAPTAVLPAYTSYASSASVWWANHSSSAIQLAKECPHYWYKALTNNPASGSWLNLTIANAECIGKSSGMPGSVVTTSSLRPAPTSLPRSSSALVSSPTSTSSSSAGTALSPDGTCGGLTGYSCLGSGFGNCCSMYGWCGDETHCDAGCQLNFGLCNAPTKISPDGTCGKINNNDGFICPESGFGDCCSAYGWCGSSSGHCDGGCQTEYGVCNAQANALTARDVQTPLIPVTRVLASKETLAATQAA